MARKKTKKAGKKAAKKAPAKKAAKKTAKKAARKKAAKKAPAKKAGKKTPKKAAKKTVKKAPAKKAVKKAPRKAVKKAAKKVVAPPLAFAAGGNCDAAQALALQDAQVMARLVAEINARNGQAPNINHRPQANGDCLLDFVWAGEVVFTVRVSGANVTIE